MARRGGPDVEEAPAPSPEEKAAILKRHHVDKVPVSTVCEEKGVQPGVFDHGQRELFTRAPQVLGASGGSKRGCSREAELERENAALRAKLAKKDQVIAEISQQYVDLKQEPGEP